MRLTAVALALLVLGAQERRPPPVVALRNATIAVDASTILERATIVLRGGFIEAVGTDVLPPPDAEVLDGGGLFVYPGFVDGWTPAGLGDTKRTPEDRQKAEATPVDFTKEALGGMEAANRKGLRPDFRAADRAAFAPADLAKHHRGGFTAAHVAAPEEYLGGAAALVALNGGPRRESVVRAHTGQAGAFRSYGDGYPSTAMGVLAHLRQALLDAQRHRSLATAYEKDPAGKARPPADPALEALWPLLDRKVPLFLEANTELEIERAVALAGEFKLDLVITGGQEAGLAVDLLKRSGVPAILSLKFPREPKKARPARTEPLKEGEYEDLPKPRKQYEDEKREWERRVRGAMTLNEAGVPFAFSTAGLPEPAGALKQVARLVAKGLPRDAAVRALTSGSAAILKAEPAYGKLAPKRPANVTVLTAPLGAMEARVRYIFADGLKFDYEPEGKAEGAPEIELGGLWTIKVEKSDAGPLEISVVLKQAGRELSGVVKSATFGEGAITFGRVGGKTFSFTAKITVDGEPSELEVRGSLREGAFKGTLSGPFGNDLSWTGRKPE
jgi:imidazolonepropionase-like amidohydrolase